MSKPSSGFLMFSPVSCSPLGRTLHVFYVTLFAIFIVAPSLPLLRAQEPPTAELPRLFINTKYEDPGGAKLFVGKKDNLQQALNEANPGDTIVLQAGATYVGNFTFPAKPNTRKLWVYLTSSAVSELPAPGNRITPQDASIMPTIVTPNASSALTIMGGGGYVRLVGIELTSASKQGARPDHTPHPVNGFSYYLLSGQNVTNVTVDRCYIHGSDTQDVIHGVGFWQNSGYISVVDSDIRDIHGSTNDSQTFIAFSSPGPFKLVNNYLSASTEDVMFGGSGGYDNIYVPSDIEVRRNHFFKPPAWLAQTTGAKPWQWQVKNNFECKACLRMIFTGNVLENAWHSGQIGSNILLTPRTKQSGRNSVVNDITIQDNVLKNANMGFSIIGYDDNCQLPDCSIAGETKRVIIRNNLILTRDPAEEATYHPMGFSMGRRMEGMLIEHNTVQGINGSQLWASFYFNQSHCRNPAEQPINIWIVGNVLGRQPTGDCGYQGQAALESYLPMPRPVDARFAGNLMFVPPDNQIRQFSKGNISTPTPFAYADPGKGNYGLLPLKQLHGIKVPNPGVDMSIIEAATSPEAVPKFGIQPNPKAGQPEKP